MLAIYADLERKLTCHEHVESLTKVKVAWSKWMMSNTLQAPKWKQVGHLGRPHTSSWKISLALALAHYLKREERKGCQLWLSNKNKSVTEEMIIFSKRKEWLKACVCVLVYQSLWDSLRPMDGYSPTDFSVHGILQGGILGWVPFPSQRHLSDQRLTLGILHCRFFTVWVTKEACYKPTVS